MKKAPKSDDEKAETLRQAEEVRDVSVEVYKRRLEDGGGPGAIDRMLEKDDDGGLKLRSRAAAYDALTRAYMAVLSDRKFRDVPDQPEQGVQHN